MARNVVITIGGVGHFVLISGSGKLKTLTIGQCRASRRTDAAAARHVGRGQAGLLADLSGPLRATIRRAAGIIAATLIQN
jgi:hypothetical protein